MAMIGFKVPHETARILGEIEVQGERRNNSHVTIKNFGDDVSIEDLGRIMVAAYGIASRVRPFTVRTSKVSCFPDRGHGVPIICVVESEPLHELDKKLSEAFDAAGIEYSKDFPVFRPHVTLSFASDPIEDMEIPTVEWGAHELVIWGGNTEDRRVLIHLPFSLENRVSSRDCVVSRLLDRRLANRILRRYKAGE